MLFLNPSVFFYQKLFKILRKLKKSEENTLHNWAWKTFSKNFNKVSQVSEIFMYFIRWNARSYQINICKVSIMLFPSSKVFNKSRKKSNVLSQI